MWHAKLLICYYFERVLFLNAVCRSLSCIHLLIRLIIILSFVVDFLRFHVLRFTSGPENSLSESDEPHGRRVALAESDEAESWIADARSSLAKTDEPHCTAFFHGVGGSFVGIGGASGFLVLFRLESFAQADVAMTQRKYSRSYESGSVSFQPDTIAIWQE